MAALAKVVAASRAEPPPPSPEGRHARRPERHREAARGEARPAAFGRREGAPGRAGAVARDAGGPRAPRRRGRGRACEGAREALERAEPIRRDLEEARRSRQAETARADAADARNAVLRADNDELRAETRSCQEKLLQALSLLEEYQEEMTDMSSRKRTGLPSRVDARVEAADAAGVAV